MVLEALQNFAQSMEKVSQRNKQLQGEDIQFLLGTKFVDQIQAATDPKSLSEAMLNANRISYQLGVPQLAQDVNNLGRIKQQELAQGKTDALNLQTAEATERVLGSQMVTNDKGEYVPLRSMDTWKDIQHADPSIRAELYNTIAAHNKTKLQSVVDDSDKNNVMLKRYATNLDTGESTLVSQLKRTESGQWTDLFTGKTGMPDPMAIEQWKAKINEKRDASELAEQKQLSVFKQELYLRQLNKADADREPKKFDLNDGSSVYAHYVGGKVKNLQGEDITDQVSPRQGQVSTGQVNNQKGQRDQAALRLYAILKARGRVDDKDDVVKVNADSFGKTNYHDIMVSMLSSDMNKLKEGKTLGVFGSKSPLYEIDTDPELKQAYNDWKAKTDKYQFVEDVFTNTTQNKAQKQSGNQITPQKYNNPDDAFKSVK
jgi:hypothetical protein